MAEVGSYPQSGDRLSLSADSQAMQYIERAINNRVAELEAEIAWLQRDNDVLQAALEAEREAHADTRRELSDAREALNLGMAEVGELRRKAACWEAHQKAQAEERVRRQAQRDRALPVHLVATGYDKDDLLRH